MKMSDASNTANSGSGDSILLDAKGREVLLECFPDGEILFWSDDGMHLEFDGKQTALIVAALRKQERLPKIAKAGAPVPPRQQRRDPAPNSPGRSNSARTDRSAQPAANLRVAKEGLGWGATVVLNHKALRYFYDKRDRAREANAAHRIGQSGRIA